VPVVFSVIHGRFTQPGRAPGAPAAPAGAAAA
jgi:hypothetical protein